MPTHLGVFSLPSGEEAYALDQRSRQAIWEAMIITLRWSFVSADQIPSQCSLESSTDRLLPGWLSLNIQDPMAFVPVYGSSRNCGY